MPRPNLRRAQRIVRPFCTANSVTYTETTLRRSYGIVIRHLNQVGLRAADPFQCPLVTAYGHGPDHPPGHETRGWCSTRRPSTNWVDTAHVQVHRRTSVLVALNPNLRRFLGAVGVLTCWFAPNTHQNVVTK